MIAYVGIGNMESLLICIFSFLRQDLNRGPRGKKSNSNNSAANMTTASTVTELEFLHGKVDLSHTEF